MVGVHVAFQLRKRRRDRAGAHVGPDDAIALMAAVRLDLDLVLEVALGRLRWHVDAITVHVELPAVVDAANARLLIPTEEQARAPMRAVVVDQPHGAGGVAEGDELLAEQLDAHGRAVGVRQLAGLERGQPVFTEEVAHECARAYAAEQVVICLAEHVTSLSLDARILRLDYNTKGRVSDSPLQSTRCWP